jgi:hypothetical protein
MVVPLIVCFLIVALVTGPVSLWLRMRVNEEVSEDRQVSWLSRDYGRVEDIYSELHPDSVLPGVSRYGRYLLMALMAGILLLGFTAKR